MVYSRISRIEERRTKKQFILVVIGTIFLLLLIFTAGIPLLVNISVMIGNLKSRQPLVDAGDQTAPFPPILAPVASATNSAILKLEGFTEPQSTLTVYVNDMEMKKVLVADDGAFSFSDITLREGENEISATSTDQAGNESKTSNTLVTAYKKGAPKLEVTEPQEDQTFGKTSQDVTVRGTTDPGNNITVNDRFVAVRDDGSFSYTVKLNDGENVLTVSVRDPAGNTTKLERKVTYQP